MFYQNGWEFWELSLEEFLQFPLPPPGHQNPPLKHITVQMIVLGHDIVF